MTVYAGNLGAGRSFVELEQCALECEKLRAQVDALAEQLQRKEAENEHLRRSLWLAQHPAHTTTTHQEAV